MKKGLATLLLSASLLLTPGCATLIVRTGHPDPRHARYVYPAVTEDFRFLGGVVREPSPLEPELAYLWYLFAAFVVLDIPVSLATDTLLLPYDLYMVTLGGKTRTGQTR